MYLIDREIRTRWPDLLIECDNVACEAVCQENIQPCSIDMCLSNVFWEPLKGKTFDLRKSRLLELAPSRYWKKRVLRRHEWITLKPGHVILGRIAAKFTIPSDCAGRIIGRSSFARLGLAIHCTGEFMNPGYRGHMPLQLCNFGPNPIKLFPYIPICQMVLVKLSGVPDHVYGAQEVQSNYMDDDGGPSYWWRDKRIHALQEVLKNRSVDLYVQEILLRKIGVQQPEIVERFEKLVAGRPSNSNENAEVLLDEFVTVEERLRRQDNVILGLAKGAFALGIGTYATVLYSNVPFMVQFGFMVFAICSVFISVWALRSRKKEYFGKAEYDTATRARESLPGA